MTNYQVPRTNFQFPSSNSKVMIFENKNQVAEAAAEHIVRLSDKAIRDTGRFTIALAGGSTPKLLYEILATSSINKIDWKAWQVFMGDERWVPLNHPESNFGMARRSLLSRVPIPTSQIYPVKTGLSSIKLAVDDYTRTLRRIFRDRPLFDLILLGLGANDRHTLSLFPQTEAVRERDAWVAWSAPGIMPPPVQRVTLTLPVVNAAKDIFFLVTGSEKAEAVADVFENPESEVRPASLVQPAEGRVTWFLDQAASSQLS